MSRSVSILALGAPRKCGRIDCHKAAKHGRKYCLKHLDDVFMEKRSAVLKIKQNQRGSVAKLAHSVLGSHAELIRHNDFLKCLIYVYAIRDGDFIKIGKAIDPFSRLSSLQVGSPNKMILLSVVLSIGEIEPMLHKKLAASNIRGEWFKITDEVLQVVEDMQDLDSDVFFAKYWDSTYSGLGPKARMDAT